MEADIGIPRLRLTEVPGFFRGEDGHVVSLKSIAGFARNETKTNSNGQARLYFYVESPTNTSVSELAKSIDLVKQEVLSLGPPIDLEIIVSLSP